MSQRIPASEQTHQRLEQLLKEGVGDGDARAELRRLQGRPAAASRRQRPPNQIASGVASGSRASGLVGSTGREMGTPLPVAPARGPEWPDDGTNVLGGDRSPHRRGP